MGYSYLERIKMFICRLANHFPGEQWEFKGVHADCRLCRKVITKNKNGDWI